MLSSAAHGGAKRITRLRAEAGALPPRYPSLAVLLECGARRRRVSTALYRMNQASSSKAAPSSRRRRHLCQTICDNLTEVIMTCRATGHAMIDYFGIAANNGGLYTSLHATELCSPPAYASDMPTLCLQPRGDAPNNLIQLPDARQKVTGGLGSGCNQGCGIVPIRFFKLRRLQQLPILLCPATPLLPARPASQLHRCLLGLNQLCAACLQSRRVQVTCTLCTHGAAISPRVPAPGSVALVAKGQHSWRCSAHPTCCATVGEGTVGWFQVRKFSTALQSPWPATPTPRDPCSTAS